MACLTRYCVIRPLRAMFSIKSSFEAPDDRQAMLALCRTALLDADFSTSTASRVIAGRKIAMTAAMARTKSVLLRHTIAGYIFAYGSKGSWIPDETKPRCS